MASIEMQREALGQISVILNIKTFRLGGARFPSSGLRLALCRRWCPPKSCSKSSRPQTFVRIYWDLDNIKPSAKSKLGSELVRAVKNTVAEAASEGLGRQIAARSVELHGHCNAHTFQQLSRELKRTLSTHDGLYLSSALSERREVVDQNIIASMLRFARLHRDNACVGIISEDQDFAQSLLYCRSLGCHTVAVCKGRPYSGKARSMKWARQPVQAAVHTALSWDAILDTLTFSEPGGPPNSALARQQSPDNHHGMK